MWYAHCEATGLENGHVTLSGAFGVFYSGRLMAHFYDDHGRPVGVMQVAEVTPTEAVSLQSEITPPEKSARVSLHLIDEQESTAERFRKYQ